MKKNNYELLIASSQEREKVYCEIYYKGNIFAEISQESDELLLEIYSRSVSNEWWKMPLAEFQEVLDIGKTFLLGIK